MLLGSLIVLLCAAGGTAVFVLEQVHTLAQDISVNKSLKVGRGVLAPTYYGGPETLLLVGDDTRKGYKYYRGYVPDLANEMLLVRIDPSKPWISMMSIPRELWVPITKPGGGTYTNRLNSAYTFGLTTLVKTIKQVTGVVPNHVVVTTFARFENAINALGCVYDTIDQRYYHNNADGGDQYQNVDLQPGYQCLNGGAAESFVSYRHTDTSQVRDARDQSFLLAAKKQYGPQLSGNIGRFERIFGRTVTTDAGLHSQTEILNLASLLVTAAGLHVRQVHFFASPLPSGDLTATPAQIHASVHNFLFGGQAPPKQQTAATAKKVKHRGALAQLPLTATLAANVAAEKAAANKIPFTAEFPKVQVSGGIGSPVAPHCTQVMQPCLRNYLIHAPDGTAYPIYTEVFADGGIGQFYDVQGTTWTDAPLFATPDQTIRVGPRVYDLYYDGGALQTVAWHENGAVYWVQNTLTNDVQNGNLLAVAEQTEPITVSKAVATQAKLNLKAAGVPLRPPVKAKQTSTLETIGSLGGLLTLIAVPVLLFVGFWRRRPLRGVRDVLSTGTTRGARLPVVPFEPGSAAARSAERARLVGAAGPGGAALVGAGAASGRGDRDRRSVSRRRSIQLVVLLLVVCAAAAAFVIVEGSGGSSTRSRGAATHRVVAKSLAPAVPTVSVAVLNAGTQPGAAGTLANQLRGEHVNVGTVGNSSPAGQGGLVIMYAAGQNAQAASLAKLLSAQHPTIAPLDTATAAAAGGAQLVVVIG